MHRSEHTITQRLSVLRPDSIRNKILVFAMLATLLPSLATAWFSYLENKRSLTAKGWEELQNASMQTARELDLWAKERRYDLRVFASSYEVTENLERIPREQGRALQSGRAYQRLTDYLNSVSERFADYDQLVIVDANGHVVASSGETLAKVSLPSDWRAQLRVDNFVLGTPQWNSKQAKPEMLIAVPIGPGGGRFMGAITAKINLQALADTLRRFAPGESGHVYVLKEDGALIVSSRNGTDADAKASHPSLVAQASDEGLPREFTDATGQRVVGSLRHVPGLDWLVVAEIPTAEVFQQLNHLRDVTLLIVTAMLLVAGSVGYALGIFIVRPLDRLTRGAAKVAAGDLEVDLPVAKGGEVSYLTEVFNDMVARLRASRRELEKLSVTDPLTGLNNRRRMMEVLENEVRRSRRLDHTFVVLMADVDHFKQYNDQHGHPAGDEALKRVASVLRESTRDVDFVARYGGEEFFVLMPELSADHGAEVAERIRTCLAKEPLLAGEVTVSFGVAEFPANGDSAETLISVADSVLYQAKKEGRDQVVVARPPERAKVVGR
ncbi:MAG TPA: diguanylate cyclase [Steroidobacteraceae bacterium]|nr:diguanylate cyclase [Steroidobacteraceae bacterium]